MRESSTADSTRSIVCLSTCSLPAKWAMAIAPAIHSPPLRHQSYLVMCIGAVTWGTQEARPLGKHASMRLAVRLPRSHITMSSESDKSIDGRGESSDHRRQQRDWP
jgi:hypothetical protein